MNAHRPWFLTVPFTEIEPFETVTIRLVAPRATPSLRKLTLIPGTADHLFVRSLKVGTDDAGRELLGTGPAPAVLFTPDQPELFDLPVECDQPIVIVLESASTVRVWTAGAIYGLGKERAP